MTYISDLAEEFLLTDGEWSQNPKTDESKSELARWLAGKDWDRQTLAFAGGYVKAIEAFTKVLHRYYEISVREFNKGNQDYAKDVEFAQERIAFLQTLKINRDTHSNSN